MYVLIIARSILCDVLKIACGVLESISCLKTKSYLCLFQIKYLVLGSCNHKIESSIPTPVLENIDGNMIASENNASNKNYCHHSGNTNVSNIGEFAF